MRKYFVKDNDGNLSWFDASHSGLEDAIEFAKKNKTDVKSKPWLGEVVDVQAMGNTETVWSYSVNPAADLFTGLQKNS